MTEFPRKILLTEGSVLGSLKRTQLYVLPLDLKNEEFSAFGGRIGSFHGLTLNATKVLALD